MNKISISALVVAAAFTFTHPAFAADDPHNPGHADVATDAVASADVAPTHVFINAAVVSEYTIDLGLARRPPALSGLYATWIGLQAYDSYSTLAGISKGAAETNPMVNGLTKNRGMFFAAKASMTLVTVALAEQMWRDHHPGRAVAMMLVSNGVMAAVAARNASVLHGLQ
jgi:hypothetical protein